MVECIWPGSQSKSAPSSPQNLDQLDESQQSCPTHIDAEASGKGLYLAYHQEPTNKESYHEGENQIENNSSRIRSSRGKIGETKYSGYDHYQNTDRWEYKKHVHLDPVWGGRRSSLRIAIVALYATKEQGGQTTS